MSNRSIWDEWLAGEGAPAQSHEMFLGIKQGTGLTPFTRTADINNLNPQITNRTRVRAWYAQKGAQAALVIGRDLTITWDHELLRDGNQQYQEEVQFLLDKSFEDGVDNLVELEFYDAMGADYAVRGRFTITHNRTNTGVDEAGAFTFTATSYDRIERIPNPVLVGNVPIINQASPAGADAGDPVYILGEQFADVPVGTPASVKFGTFNAASFEVVSDNLIRAVIPATGTAGLAPITVTNPAGPSDEFPYTRG